MYKELSEIEGFETCTNYTVYSDGRVYSRNSNKYLKPLKDSKGYYYIDLRYQGAKLKCPKVHQLVMFAFSDQEEKEHINHIDGDKANNDISNLEYVTNRENREHALKTGLKDEIAYGIGQYTLKGELLNIFDTAGEALEFLGIKNGSPGNIGRVIRGNRKTAYGYIWKQYEGSTTIEK